MANVPATARVVVIGAGIVGNSLVHHLAELGWTDIVQLDMGPLPNPGGSTGHASNFIFPVDHSREITDLTLDSVRQYKEMDVFTESGGYEIARTEERMEELRRRMSSAKAWGIEAELVTPEFVTEKVPFLDADSLHPLENVRKMADMGLFGVNVPKQYGGQGLDTVSYISVIEQLARVDASHSITISAHGTLGLSPILNFGTADQKQRWLPPLIEGRADYTKGNRFRQGLAREHDHDGVRYQEEQLADRTGTLFRHDHLPELRMRGIAQRAPSRSRRTSPA